MDTEAYGHAIQMEDMSLSTCCDINWLMKSKGVEAPYPTDYTRRLPMQNKTAQLTRDVRKWSHDVFQPVLDHVLSKTTSRPVLSR